MPEAKKSSRIFDYLIILALVYLITQFGMRWFFPSQQGSQATAQPITIQSANVRSGNAIPLIVHNNTNQPLQIASHCPLPPVAIAMVQGSGTLTTVTPAEAAHDTCKAPAVIEAGKQGTVDLSPWKYSMFATPGTYEVSLQAGTGTLTTRFAVAEPGAFVKLFRTFLTRPFLNFLVLTASILPSHSLAIGIILLTILVKLLLFIPTQHALEGQKKMQLLQPKLEVVRKQYKDNPVKMQEETMKLWKEHGVNPLQSCLPILVQFPVLIALFYVIRDNVNLSLSSHLLYGVYSHLTWGFNTHFLGLDLTQPNVWVFPPLLVVLQFIQMKLSFLIADKKKEKQIEKAEKDTATAVQQQVMTYALPFMIGFFALKFPSAVSLYWGISTLFAIGQQMIVNREHIRA